MTPRRLVGLGACVAALICTPTAQAHSASDAYLTLDVDPASATVRGQWDIALRDLDFVLQLDGDGDGDITWAELRGRQAAIARYATAHLRILGDAKTCALKVDRQLVDNHADGAYAVVYFGAHCASIRQRATLAYSLFFDIDPSHRAIVVAHTGADTATALMSPQNARIELGTAVPAVPAASAGARRQSSSPRAGVPVGSGAARASWLVEPARIPSRIGRRFLRP